MIQTPPPVKFTPGISQIKAFRETKVTVEAKTMRSGSTRHYFMPQFFSADLRSQQGGFFIAFRQLVSWHKAALQCERPAHQAAGHQKCR